MQNFTLLFPTKNSCLILKIFGFAWGGGRDSLSLEFLLLVFVIDCDIGNLA